MLLKAGLKKTFLTGSVSEERPETPCNIWGLTTLELVFFLFTLNKNLAVCSQYLVIEPVAAAAAAKLLQSCPTLCNPIDGSPPGSAIPGILQARTLEWVAISFSNA